jgi:hypothetical protein
MGLVKIDMIDLQPSQRGLALTQDIVLLQAAAFTHVLADLGGNQNPVAFAAALQPVANNRFRFTSRAAGEPARVAVGGVDGIKAGIDESIEDAE